MKPERASPRDLPWSETAAMPDRPATADSFEAARRRRRRTEAWAALGLAGPATVLLFLLLLGPTAAVLVLSATDWQLGAKTMRFVGFGNYAEMFADRVFRQSLANTLLYVAITVPISVGLGLGAAMLIDARASLQGFYRTVYFLPVTATLIAMAVVWEFLFHPNVGLVNLLLKAVGIPGTHWLNNPSTALYALCAIGIWQSLGFTTVLFLAGLKSVPGDLYDAAAVDGADGAWERFRRVTWPMLGPTLMFVLVIMGIRSFQVFDTVAVLTAGGPAKSTEVLLYTMYTEGFHYFRTGYGSAITVVFLLFVLVLTLLQVRFLDRRVHYS
jgi:multiple sugar transport system permease protein